MKFKIILLVSILLIFFSNTIPTLSAQSQDEIKGKVELIIGKAYLKDSKKWVPLSINSIIKKKDTIKVNHGATVKIKLNNGTLIEVKGRKIEKLANLISSKDMKAAKGAKNNILKKLGKTGPSATGVTAVAGVRGADVSKQNKKVKTNELKWKK